VYIDGEIGNLQGVVFPEWSQIDIIPEEAELLAYGLDWGFTNDPTCIVEVYRYNKSLILNELLYQTGLTNSQLVNMMESLNIRKDVDIIADSAEPKSIQDLYDRGYHNVYPAIKGEDSIRNGIAKLQEFPLIITSSSINGIREARNYIWQKDKDGKLTGKPIDNNNHFWDPARYVALNCLSDRRMEFH
jgi:phage terminase large subunit